MISCRRLSIEASARKPAVEKTEKEFFEAYLKDASNFSGRAEKIVFPETEEQVSLFLSEANRQGIPVTVSGGGTGLTGGRVPQDGAILATEKLNRIINIEWNDAAGEGRADVECGVLLKDFDEALRSRNLFYPPDPTEKTAFIGATVATNASGARSFKYGATRRYVNALRIVLANGDLLEIRRGQHLAGPEGFRVSFSDGTATSAPLPGYRMPPIKNAAGYYNRPGMDLVDLFVGSEGTLGVVTRAELKVLRPPEAVLSGIVFFRSESDAYNFMVEARRLSRAGTDGKIDFRLFEFFDSRSLRFLSRKYGKIPAAAGAALFLEQECAKNGEDAVLESWVGLLSGFGALLEESWISGQAKDQAIFKEFRHDLPVLVNEQVARNGFRKIGTDMAVPDESAGKMMDLYLEELGRSGIEYVIFGHFGDNHLHANLLPRTQAEFDQAKTLYGSLVKKAVEFGGTVSAEHGIGKLKSPYLELMYGREGIRGMARVKAAFDPRGILNPGNIFSTELFREAAQSR